MKPARAGLFHGFWYGMDGKKIRRIYRSEYPELYRLVGKHADISNGTAIRQHRRDAAVRLGIQPIGSREPWHG